MATLAEIDAAIQLPGSALAAQVRARRAQGLCISFPSPDGCLTTPAHGESFCAYCQSLIDQPLTRRA